MQVVGQPCGESDFPFLCWCLCYTGVVTIAPRDGVVFVNGEKVEEAMVLKTGARLILGTNHVFRFIHPEQAREERERLALEGAASGEVGPIAADWSFAQRELVQVQGEMVQKEMEAK